MKVGVDLNLGTENEALEFKKSTGELKEVMYSICAILNKHQQGELYFGVKPDGTPVGQVVTKESLREVRQKIKNHIEPKIYQEINKVVLDERDCIHVKFSGEQVPYFEYGVVKIRVADEISLNIQFGHMTLGVLQFRIQIKKTVLNQLELTDGDKILNTEKAFFSDGLIQEVQMAIFAASECLTFNDIQRHHSPILKLVDIAESYIKSIIH